MASTSVRVRPLDILDWDVAIERKANGCFYVRPLAALGEYPCKLTDRLDEWAARDPSRTFLAERTGGGDWRRMSYAEFRDLSRNVAQALVDREISPERPITILSGNDIEHALLAIGAMYAGIPYAPLAPAYSLACADIGRLREIFHILNPGLVFASDGAIFLREIEALLPDDTELVVTRNPVKRARLFRELTGTLARPELRSVAAHITPDTVAKILFTSGSTGTPKGVINTHRMLCSNQEQLRTVFRFLTHTAPVICDWLPWNHTFGGNHNFGLVLYNGGTLYIDNGRPTRASFPETARNLHEIAPNVYFNVPKGYAMLAEYLRDAKSLRERFFCNLQMMFYAAAGLSQCVWDALDELAIETCGERIRMLTGLGATETAPFALCVNTDSHRAGIVGLPVPGVELKLAPVDGKLEARVRGPNVTPGFWRRQDLACAAFDDEGYYRMGDALRFAEEPHLDKSFVFDGRLSEDFKLSTGTWVSVGPLRTSMLLHFGSLVKDIVIAGHDRDEVTALIFPGEDAFGAGGEETDVTDPGTAIRVKFQALLNSFAHLSTGSSNRVVRAILVNEPPSLDSGDVTDKGSLNQAAVLKRRAALVEDVYRIPCPAHVIEIDARYRQT